MRKMNKKILAVLMAILILASISVISLTVLPTFASEKETSHICDEPDVEAGCEEEPCPTDESCDGEEVCCASTIVDVAIAVNSEGEFAGYFDTLIAALLAADPVILETLSSCDGEFTVFAPTDDAFKELDLTPCNVDELPQEFLNDVLLYHVTEGGLLASDVLGLESICMLKGGVLLQDGGVLTDNVGRDATIVVTDVEADNGVIHVIDSVVLPYLPSEDSTCH